MPTGYTADISKGITFETFAMNCARAFGACVALRDEPPGGEFIPDRFEPSPYHAQRLEEAKADLAALDAMMPAELDRAAAKDYDEQETRRVTALADRKTLRGQYEAMLAKVRAWRAPTEEHVELKSFMEEQIIQSIEIDCGGTFYNKPTEMLTGEQWRDARRKALERSVNYHEREHAEEVKRSEDRSNWVNTLRQSLRPTRAP